MPEPEPYRTADYAAYFRVIRDHLRHSRTTTQAPSTYPDPVAHCDVCAYWQYCDQRRRTDDDPSLIAGIHRGHVQELKRQRLPTLTAFANAGALPEVVGDAGRLFDPRSPAELAAKGSPVQVLHIVEILDQAYGGK